jgi:hypothetical protein
VGPLRALVTHNNGTSGNPAGYPVAVGAVTNALGAVPFVEIANNTLTGNTMTLTGANLGTTQTDVRVYLTAAQGADLGVPINQYTYDARNIRTGLIPFTGNISGGHEQTGDPIIAKVTSNAATSIGLTITTMQNFCGNLEATVTVRGVPTATTLVASVKGPGIYPTLTSIAKLNPSSGAKTYLEIHGINFGTSASQVNLQFSPALTGVEIWRMYDTLLLVRADSSSLDSATGELKAQVSRTGFYGTSGWTTVGRFRTVAAAPIVTASSDIVDSNANYILLSSSNLGTHPSDVRVYLFPAAGPQPPAVTSISYASTYGLQQLYESKITFKELVQPGGYKYCSSFASNRMEVSTHAKDISRLDCETFCRRSMTCTHYTYYPSNTVPGWNMRCYVISSCGTLSTEATDSQATTRALLSKKMHHPLFLTTHLLALGDA